MKLDVNFLKHLGLLALFAAIVPVLGAVLAVIGTFNVATLPLAYQAFAYAVLPVIVGAIKVAQAKAAAAEAAEAAKDAEKKVAVAEAKASAAEAKVVELTAKSKKA